MRDVLYVGVMSELGQPGRPWWRTRWFGGAAAVVVLVPAAWFGIRTWLINDTSEAVPTDEVVADFRAANSTTTTSAVVASTTTARPPGATSTDPPAPVTTPTSAPTEPVTTTSEPPPTFELPAPGVYRYVTTGFEEIDALDGARHEYPAETTITVTADDCGVRLRWDILRERREEWSLCIGSGGIEVQPASIQYHEFFGQSEEELVECAGGVVLVGVEPGAPATTDQGCFRVDEAWLPVWSVIGAETLTVDGADVEVVHVRQEVFDDDDYWEYTVIDWYVARNGLPVRIVNDKESKSPTFVGDVVYVEEYQADLVSLTPIT